MARRRKSYLWVGALACFLFAATGFGIVLTPSNPLTRVFRASISDKNSRIVTGPFPLTSDFRMLRDHGVRTVVSLLDPNIPYERVLLDQEKKNAAKFGMKFTNFPMPSILGHHMYDYYDVNAARAAAYIDSLQKHSNEKLYLHCYLGMHRMVTVRDLLASRGTLSGSYTVRHAARSRDEVYFDSAIYAYQGNDLRGAIRLVSQMRSPDVPAMLVRGWSNYRLKNIALAKQDFQAVLSIRSDMYDANNGLGYCYLATEQLDSARAQFTQVLARDDDDPQAEAGLAMIDYRTGNRTQAAMHLRTSLQSDSTNAEARTLLAQIERAK
jgi:tetratricopeptide (TPR) repeat protein